MSTNLENHLDELVTANHILANKNVVDSFGHISVHNSEDLHDFILSCSQSPAIVTFYLI